MCFSPVHYLFIQQTSLCDGLCQVLIDQGQEELNILDIDALQLSQYNTVHCKT